MEFRSRESHPQPEVWQKRITQLAKQTCGGLERICGVTYDYSTFASLLHDAYKVGEPLANAVLSTKSGFMYRVQVRSQRAAAASTEREVESKRREEESKDKEETSSTTRPNVPPLATGSRTQTSQSGGKKKRETKSEQRARERREEEERLLAVLDAALKYGKPGPVDGPYHFAAQVSIRYPSG